MDINKTVVSNKVSFGKKGFTYFVGYKDTNKIRPLCIILSKMGACRKYFDETKYIFILIKHDELLKNTIKFGKKIKNNLKKGFHIEPVYNEYYLKARVKSYKEKINTNFHDNKISKKVLSLFVCQ